MIIIITGGGPLDGQEYEFKGADNINVNSFRVPVPRTDLRTKLRYADLPIRPGHNGRYYANWRERQEID